MVPRFAHPTRIGMAITRSPAKLPMLPRAQGEDPLRRWWDMNECGHLRLQYRGTQSTQNRAARRGSGPTTLMYTHGEKSQGPLVLHSPLQHDSLIISIASLGGTLCPSLTPTTDVLVSTGRRAASRCLLRSQWSVFGS